MQFAQKSMALGLCLMFAIAPIRAQQSSVVDPGAIDQTLAARTAETDAKRASVRTALEQPQVLQVAERFGLDVTRALGAVGTLQGAELDRIAAQAQLVNDELAGGQTVTMNVVWIIIVLLLLILLIVAVS